MLMYSQADLGYADFRVVSDAGQALTVDWDTSLQWQFYDAANTLQFTATTTSNPPIETSTDTQGTYYFVRNLDLSSWALGAARTEIAAQVGGEPISPNPYIEYPFQVIATIGANEALYTTVTRVRDELPGSVPSTLTDAQITVFIADASRHIDARLPNYSVPFNAIGATPSTPRVIEKAARLLTAHACLLFVGELRGDATVAHQWQAAAEQLLTALNPVDDSPPSASLPPNEYDYSKTPAQETRRTTEAGRAHSFYTTDIARADGSTNSTGGI